MPGNVSPDGRQQRSWHTGRQTPGRGRMAGRRFLPILALMGSLGDCHKTSHNRPILGVKKMDQS